MPAYDVVICGAGIAGISAAYWLSVRRGLKRILLLDERPPLSLTSDKSTECYRNWWPDPAMVSLMDRSIDLIEDLARQSGNVFHLNRRGYLYVTTDPARVSSFQAQAERIAALGPGPLRLHRDLPSDLHYQPHSVESFEDQPTGADLLLGSDLIHHLFPYLSPGVVAALHARRAGWFSAQQLGMLLLQQARQAGVELRQASLTGVSTSGGRVSEAILADGSHIPCGSFVNAAGPFLKPVGRMVGAELPVVNEVHIKAAFKDTLGVLPRQAPFLILADPQRLEWTPDERSFLAEDAETRWLLDELPAGAHTRPEGGADSQIVLILWEYRTLLVDSPDQIQADPDYPELVLRGLSRLVPGMSQYIGRLSRPSLDGGCYTRTPENRPLIGSLPVEGAYVLGALSGYGLMAACASGELLAAHILNEKLPDYAPAFHPSRFADPAYLRQLASWGDTGQL